MQSCSHAVLHSGGVDEILLPIPITDSTSLDTIVASPSSSASRPGPPASGRRGVPASQRRSDGGDCVSALGDSPDRGGILHGPSQETQPPLGGISVSQVGSYHHEPHSDGSVVHSAEVAPLSETQTIAVTAEVVDRKRGRPRKARNSQKPIPISPARRSPRLSARTSDGCS
jgi:hypothetical protein